MPWSEPAGPRPEPRIGGLPPEMCEDLTWIVAMALYDTTITGRVFHISGSWASHQKSHQYSCLILGAAMMRG